MTAQTLRNLIYYPHGPSGIESDMAAIAADPYYSNVVLGQFHMDETHGILSWNDTPIADVTQDEWDAVKSLSQGQYPKIVSLQIGSAGNGTWTYIQNNMASAASILANAANGANGIVGVDLDPEPVGAVSLDTIYNLTLQLGVLKQQSFLPLPCARALGR